MIRTLKTSKVSFFGGFDIQYVVLHFLFVVIDANQTLTLASCLAYEQCRNGSRSCLVDDISGDHQTYHVICHVTPTSKCFVVQQSLVLCALYQQSKKRVPTGTLI